MVSSRRPRPLPLPPPDGAFVAIDFETADHGPDSACAVGVVRVEALSVVRREVVLIRPPRSRFQFTHIHGITWEMVRNAPSFADAWPVLLPLLDGASTLVAHNAPFDRRVLAACCAAGGLCVPELPFLCTVQLARRYWRRERNDLASVCRRLGIALVHHDPGSDAEACAGSSSRPPAEPSRWPNPEARLARPSGVYEFARGPSYNRVIHSGLSGFGFGSPGDGDDPTRMVAAGHVGGAGTRTRHGRAWRSQHDRGLARPPRRGRANIGGRMGCSSSGSRSEGC